MNGPHSTYINAAGHEMHVTEWGDPKKPALVMWHGLARTGRDFDEAAEALSDTYFVLCPDTLGRGLSAWAKSPETDYSYRTYGDMALAMLDRYSIGQLRWVGTSMGGLLGVTLAGGRLKERISHLVINDIGPEIQTEGIGRIADYVGHPPVCDTIGEMEAWLRANYAQFGQNSEAFWRRMTDTSVRRTDNGRVTVHYDPKIAEQLSRPEEGLDLWKAYDAISAQALILRGETSDVLAPAVAGEMQKRGPKPALEVLAGYGHAPTITSAYEQALVRRFLAA
jgi:pimeloyl-ACP methyl ester carboxylesterase